MPRRQNTSAHGRCDRATYARAPHAGTVVARRIDIAICTLRIAVAPLPRYRTRNTLTDA